MPIVVAAAEDSGLMQGDVLRDIPLVVVDCDGKAALDTTAPYVLVLSRPCKALRDDLVVVAPVVPYPIDLSEVQKSGNSPQAALDRTRRYLSGIRDGIKGLEFSDVLYLGPIEWEDTKRFAVQLTTLCTARVPKGSAERLAWIKEHRVCRLHAEFLRDLHTRLVLTFTRLGFDDHAWYPDADLDVMISAGRAETLHLQNELVAAEQAIQKTEAANKPIAPGQRTEIERKRVQVQEAEARLDPYLEERSRRSKRL